MKRVNILKISVSRNGIKTKDNSVCINKIALIDVQNRTLEAESISLYRDENNKIYGVISYYHPKYLETIKFVFNTDIPFPREIVDKIPLVKNDPEENENEGLLDEEITPLVFKFNSDTNFVWIPTDLDDTIEYYIELKDWAQIPHFIKGIGFCPISNDKSDEYFTPKIKIQAMDLNEKVLGEKEYIFNSKEEIENCYEHSHPENIENEELPCCILDFRRNSKIETTISPRKARAYNVLNIEDDNTLTAQEDVIEEEEEYYDCPIPITHRQFHQARDWLIELKNTNKVQDEKIKQLEDRIFFLESLINEMNI